MDLSLEHLLQLKRQSVLKHIAVCIVSAIIAWLAYSLQYQNKVDELKTLHDQKLITSSVLFSRELGSIRDLLLLIKNSPALAKTPSKKQDIVNQTTQISTFFQQFGKSTTNIAQIRWIENSGQELIRVNFKDGLATVIPKDELQNKQARYYFQQGIASDLSSIYFSPIDLNVEHGEVVLPFEPTLRATMRTTAATHLIDGLLVINFRLDSLFTTLKNISVDKANIQLVNAQGYWLLNQQAEKEWGFVFDKPQLTLAEESPVLWNDITQNKTGDFITENILTSFAHLDYLLGLDTSNDNKLIIYASSAPAFLSAVKLNAMLFSLLLFSALAAVGLVFNWRAASYQSELISLSIKLRAEQQELTQANKSLQQIIERQQILQDELVESNKLSALGLMVAGVAHELNTPLGGALISVTNAEHANEKLKKAMLEGITKTQFNTSIGVITDSLHLASINLDKAVEQVKHFKRLAIDRVSADCIACTIDDIVSDLLISLRPTLKKTQIEIKVSIEENMKLKSRPGTISQVIENLIMNCINHAFSPQEPGIIEIKAYTTSENKIEIVVADNGRGIPQALQSKIFEPFVTSARSSGNIGLGLHMVNQWVTKLLLGQLRFSSGKRAQDLMTTEFVIIIPQDIS
ncbi:MAG: HAMP domain-containing histidine kinase, partial [Paraglaciecola sp.]|nr:HAMP domain-containing histidine kinase [Paraglaciecola sp.]